MNFIKPLVSITTKYAPEILTAAGLLCMGAAVVEAVENTQKMLDEVDSEKNKKALTQEALSYEETMVNPDSIELTFFEKSGIVLKTMWPTLAFFTLGGVCIVGAHKITLDRLATMALAADAYKNRLKEKDENEREFLSEKRYGELQEYAARKSIEKEYDPTTGLLPESPAGEMWIVDSTYGGKFISTPGDVMARIERMRRDIDGGRSISVNEFRDEVSDGELKNRHGADDKGWNFDACDTGDALDIKVSVVKDPAGQQCCVLSYTEPNVNVGIPVKYR